MLDWGVMDGAGIALEAAGGGSLPGVHRWGLEVVRAVQGIESPALTAFMKAVSALGDGWFYGAALLFVFWCVDERKGARLAMLVILSGWLTGCLKAAFHQPRPFALDPSVARVFEPGYGLPSGHAENSLVFWLAPLACLRGKAAAALAVCAAALVPLTALSRLYLGVHFPTDILAGWLAGGLTLAAFFAVLPKAEALLARGGLRAALVCAAALSLGMNALRPGDTGLSGLFLGFSAGYALNRRFLRFGSAAPVNGGKPGPARLLARCLLGLAGGAAVFLGLKALFPGPASDWHTLGRFVRYGAAGLWASAGAPWLFLSLRLAARRAGFCPCCGFRLACPAPPVTRGEQGTAKSTFHYPFSTFPFSPFPAPA
jgi:membrane-associated phospholipid phosphatase